jgi:hypothetical protein
MAKGNQKYEREATEREQARSQGEYDSFLNQFLGRSSTPSSVAKDTADYKKPGGIAGGIFGAAKGAIGGAGGGRHNTTGTSSGNAVAREDEGGGLTHSSRYEQLQKQGDEERDYMRSGLRGLAETGGFDQGGIDDFRARYQGALGQKATANLSDFTDVDKRYTDFADTGGYSGGDIQRIRAQSARNAPSFYNALRDQQGIAASRMGANAGAGAGLDMKMARQAAQGSAQDKLAANIGLAESQREGKKYGITGLEGTQTERGRQSLEQAGLDNQYNLGAGGITADAEGRIADMSQKGKIAGYGGLMDLYGSNYKPQSDFENTWLSAVGDSSKSTQGNRGLQLQNDEVNRSRLAENIIGGIGAAAGGLTGIGAIGSAIGGLTGGGGGGGSAPAPGLSQQNLFQGSSVMRPGQFGGSTMQQPNYGYGQNIGMFGQQQQRQLPGLSGYRF